MDTTRDRTYPEYTRLRPSELAERKEGLARLQDRELMLLFYREGDYVARDVLIDRNVLGDTRSATISDYAHHIVVAHVGAKRVAKPSNQLPWPLNRRTARPGGVWMPDGRRLQVRTHTRTAANRKKGGGRFSLKSDPWQRDFHGMLGVVFDENLYIEGAWVIPWPVTDEYRNSTSLKVDGAWRSDARVESLVLGG